VPAPAAVEPPALDDPRWAKALQAVADEPGLLRLHAQPIVELTSGTVAGYELLSRFTGPWQAPPDRWFAAAERWRFNALLQARVLRAGIDARTLLPPNTFLTLNIDPHLLIEPEVAEVLTGTPDLSRVIIELTEHTQTRDRADANDVLDHVRAAGGMLAMDDAGTGYAGLSQLLELRPQIVKLDRDLITGIDTDPVKAALVEVFGDLAGRMDAWILAEGIETTAELEVLIRLGVPLGQGFALARPAQGFLPALEASATAHIAATAARSSLSEHVASLIRPLPATSGQAGEVQLDRRGQAKSVRAESDSGWAPAMLVSPSTQIVDAARRAMARCAQDRYAPLVCTDSHGQVIGTIGINDLLLALCSSTTAGFRR
jgi:EAL domain-containing protein (putative c-di-GMP-specific phosphodiesterase class I)